MAKGIKTGNKGCSSKFHVDSRVQQTSEEGHRTYQLKRCGNNNKVGDNSPKTLNDKKLYVLQISTPICTTYIY